MPRKPTITPDGAVAAIREAEQPFVSTGELADHFDVTRQAVRDRKERLSEDPRIEVGMVSNNTVFYLSAGADPTGGNNPGGRVGEPGEGVETLERPERDDPTAPDRSAGEDDESDGGWFDKLPLTGQDLPGVVLMGIAGYVLVLVGWGALKECHSRVKKDSGKVKETAFAMLTAGMVSSVIGTLVLVGSAVYTSTLGPTAYVLSLIATSVVAGALAVNGGVLGSMARLSELFFRRLSEWTVRGGPA